MGRYARKLGIPAILLVCLCWTVESLAGIRPSFSLAYSAWYATHIVIATEGEKIDGEFTVLESWKGDLDKSARISIPSLARFADEKSRTLENLWRAPGEEKLAAKTVTGTRMILFLVKKNAPADVGDNRSGDEAEKKDFPWAPSSLFGGMFVSAAWVEDGKLYGFVQVKNPGPSMLIDLNMTEQQAREEVDRINNLQRKQREAAAVADPEKRAEALRPFATSGWVWSRQEAFKALEGCGESALPTLRAIFRDESLDELSYGYTVGALVKVGGTKVGWDLTTQLEKDVAFWMQEGPKLDKGWWGNQKLADRYCRTLDIVVALRELRYAPCRDTIVRFRDFWRSLPHLEDKSGLDQMSKACDAVLRAIDQAEP